LAGGGKATNPGALINAPVGEGDEKIVTSLERGGGGGTKVDKSTARQKNHSV